MNTAINFLHNLLDSQATATSIAIIAVILTLSIYYIRRKDHKRDAANIILLELQNAETRLGEARKVYEEARAKDPRHISFPEKLRLMKTESWTKYKYLFVRDFESTQWQLIGDFYENCLNFDEAVEHKDLAFSLNETDIRAGIQATITAYSKELADSLEPNPNNDVNIDKANQALTDDISRRKEIAIQTNIQKLVYIYNPDKSFTDAAYYYSLLPTSIINTPTGNILKKIAGKTKGLHFFKKA